MQSLIDTISGFESLLPIGLTLILAAAVLWTADWFLFRRPVTGFLEARVVRQLVMLVLSVVLGIVSVFVLPLEDNAREQLLSIIGLLLTAVIAFASTTFVSNAMAGLMLRAVRNFSPGDFIRVGDHFGRVTERGLFHTEIQTEDRDLTTLPNLHLVSNPVKVVRSSGTIVSVELSLGYDVAHQQVAPLLVAAAEEVGLEGAYVQVRDLLDHAVVYRVAGFLRDVTDLLSAGSRLRGSVIDHLHGAGIEIASPSLMNQRQLPAGVRILPTASAPASEEIEAGPSAEKLAFDKAEQAAEFAKLGVEAESLDEQIKELERAIKKSGEDASGRRHDELARLVARRASLAASLEESTDPETG